MLVFDWFMRKSLLKRDDGIGFTSGNDSNTSTGSKPPGPKRAWRSSSYKVSILN